MCELAKNEEYVFQTFSSMFSIGGTSVLEIGGSLPLQLLSDNKATNVCSWVSVDPMFKPRNTGNTLHIPLSIQDVYLCDNYFDYAFSANAFHLIHDFEGALKIVYRLLKPGGILFSHFGPVWSAPDGHQIEGIVVDGTEYNFWETPLLPPWAHLVLDKVEMFNALLKHHGEQVATKVCSYIYDSISLNRILADDYARIFVKIGFDIIDLRTSSKIDYEWRLLDSPYDVSFTVMITKRLKHLSQKTGHSDFDSRDMLVALKKPMLSLGEP